MGSTSRIFCNECDGKIDINIGPGMMYWSLDNLADPEDKNFSDMFNLRKTIKNKYDEVREGLGESLFVCDECKYWDNRLSAKFIAVDNNESIVFEYKHVCPKCSKELIEVDEEKILDYIKCPKCSSNSLSIDKMWMLWD